MSANGPVHHVTYEAVIGLEVHVQLATATKIFCGCSTAAAAPPNTRTCPVCLGMPGAMPVLNDRAVDLAVLASLALGARVSTGSVFARKHYFYPDLPKGYQITQFDEPLATGGDLSWTANGRRCRVRLVRIHLEEDAGKLLHEGAADADASACVDYNRSGVPLVEIVTEPDLHAADDAAGCFRRLRSLLVAVGATDGNMEQGSLRCDANVSVRPSGSSVLGARTEIKNLNSFRFLKRALDYEIERQIEAYRRGDGVQSETRLWDSGMGRTAVMRRKETSDDYRYFPEPDLPPLVITPERLAGLRESVPELPEQRRRRLMAQYGLADDDAEAMAASSEVSAYFERTAARAGDSGAAAMWIRGEMTRRLHERGQTLSEVAVTPDALARLIVMAASGIVSATAAKRILGRMCESGDAPDDIAAADGVVQNSDEDALAALVDATLAVHPVQVAQYREGRQSVAGFLVGQVLKAGAGRANPAKVDRLVRAWLSSGPRP